MSNERTGRIAIGSEVILQGASDTLILHNQKEKSDSGKLPQASELSLSPDSRDRQEKRDIRGRRLSRPDLHSRMYTSQRVWREVSQNGNNKKIRI
jgi:hypothetical protein